MTINFVAAILFLNGKSIIIYSYTPRTLRACCSQSEFKIFKIRKSSARALFFVQLHSEQLTRA